MCISTGFTWETSGRPPFAGIGTQAPKGVNFAFESEEVEVFGLAAKVLFGGDNLFVETAGFNEGFLAKTLEFMFKCANYLVLSFKCANYLVLSFKCAN